MFSSSIILKSCNFFTTRQTITLIKSTEYLNEFEWPWFVIHNYKLSKNAEGWVACWWIHNNYDEHLFL